MNENTEKKIGTKRIMDVPIIEELGENSYVLVNNNGEAAQISGSKVGGGGDKSKMPDLLYGVRSENGYLLCSSPDEATAVDYETGKPRFLHDKAFYIVQEGAVVAAFAAGGFIRMYDDDKVMSIENMGILFSDTVLPEN